VCQHLVSPASDGLFSHAIMQSGSCDGPWIISGGADVEAFGTYYAACLGCDQALLGAVGMMACMRALPLADLLEPYSSWFGPDWPNTTQALANMAVASGAGSLGANFPTKPDTQAGAHSARALKSAPLASSSSSPPSSPLSSLGASQPSAQKPPPQWGFRGVRGAWPADRPIGPLAPPIAWTGAL
jgi:hypothetical protein